MLDYFDLPDWLQLVIVLLALVEFYLYWRVSLALTASRAKLEDLERDLARLVEKPLPGQARLNESPLLVLERLVKRFRRADSTRRPAPDAAATEGRAAAILAADAGRLAAVLEPRILSATGLDRFSETAGRFAELFKVAPVGGHKELLLDVERLLELDSLLATSLLLRTYFGRSPDKAVLVATVIACEELFRRFYARNGLWIGRPNLPAAGPSRPVDGSMLARPVAMEAALKDLAEVRLVLAAAMRTAAERSEVSLSCLQFAVGDSYKVYRPSIVVDAMLRLNVLH
jgi:hypothetical protein